MVPPISFRDGLEGGRLGDLLQGGGHTAVDYLPIEAPSSQRLTDPVPAQALPGHLVVREASGQTRIVQGALLLEPCDGGIDRCALEPIAAQGRAQLVLGTIPVRTPPSRRNSTIWPKKHIS